MTHDVTVRPVLRRELEAGNPGALVVDELGLELGACRIDLAVIGDSLDGYEIKAAADTLDRLPSQSCVYNRTLDRVTIVAASNHLAGVMASRWVPAWWGVWEIQADGFRVERGASTNPEFDLGAHAQLLWKGELAALFERHMGRRPSSRWVKIEIRHALVSSVDPITLRADIRWALRARTNWRVRARMAPRGATKGEG